MIEEIVCEVCGLPVRVLGRTSPLTSQETLRGLWTACPCFKLSEVCGLPVRVLGRTSPLTSQGTLRGLWTACPCLNKDNPTKLHFQSGIEHVVTRSGFQHQCYSNLHRFHTWTGSVWPPSSVMLNSLLSELLFFQPHIPQLCQPTFHCLLKQDISTHFIGNSPRYVDCLSVFQRGQLHKISFQVGIEHVVTRSGLQHKCHSNLRSFNAWTGFVSPLSSVLLNSNSSELLFFLPHVSWLC